MPQPANIAPFVPPTTTHTIEIVVNYRRISVPHEVTGSEIKSAAHLPADFRLFRVDGQDETPIGDDERIHVHDGERFVACPTLDPAFVTNPAHAEAIAAVRDTFKSHEIAVDEPGDGTTTLTVCGVAIGSGWNFGVIDLSVKLQVTFPSTPPYPYYGPPGMTRIDGRSFSQIQPQVRVDGEHRTQISLNKPFDPASETLAGRLVTVIAWLRSPR
jgi:hypothetical protein